MECFVQLKSTSTDCLTSDAVNLQSCYWQTLKQCKPFVSYSFLVILDMVPKTNTARHLCAGDGFSNKYSHRENNSCWLQPVLCWITLGVGLILSVFLVMSALARALSTAGRELAAPAYPCGQQTWRKSRSQKGNIVCSLLVCKYILIKSPATHCKIRTSSLLPGNCTWIIHV